MTQSPEQFRFSPGVCLTFDDLFVENWVNTRDVFAEFGVRATFCVCHLHIATPKQRSGLLQLQDDGHEIALHTRTHPRLMPYIEAHGVENWLHEEVEKGLAEHRAAGLTGQSFAFPHHVSTPETRNAVAPLFTSMRIGRPFWRNRGQFPSRVYTSPTLDGGYDNLGSIDFRHRKHRGLGFIGRMLDAISDQGGVGVFTGHDIRPVSDGDGFYATKDDIRALLSEVQRRNLRYYRLSELGKMPS